jgi:hypothetical protein
VIPLKNLAPRKIHTRRNPDPNPAQEVIDPEKILRKSERKSSKQVHLNLIDLFLYLNME